MFQNQANGQHKACLKTTKFPWQWPHAAQGSLQTPDALARTVCLFGKLCCYCKSQPAKAAKAVASKQATAGSYEQQETSSSSGLMWSEQGNKTEMNNKLISFQGQHDTFIF